MNRFCFSKFYILALPFMLAACGGGSGDTSTPPSNPPAPQGPAFTSSTQSSIMENTNEIAYQASATGSGPIAYNISGGIDREEFVIDNSSGAVSILSTPDFESPKDSDLNNEYLLEITATDINELTDTIDVTILVTDQTILKTTITFPTQNANLADIGDTATVSGIVFDEEDGQVLEGDIVSLTVNQTDASVNPENGTWTASIPLESAEELITVFTLDRQDNNTTSTIALNNQASFQLGIGMVFDETNNQLILSAYPNGRLVSIDIDSGDQKHLYNPYDGLETPFQLGHIDYDESNNRIFVAGSMFSTLYEVDLASKVRTKITDDVENLNSFDVRITGVNFDPDGNQVLLTDSGFDSQILSTNLTTGVVTKLSGEFVGAGQRLVAPGSGSLDQINNRLILQDKAGINSIDLSTGDRTLLSPSDEYPAFSFSSRNGVVLTQDNTTAYMTDYVEESVYRVDLTTGDRELISGLSIGEGIAMEKPKGISIHETNNRLFVLNQTGHPVISIDLETGDRTPLGKLRTQNGPEFVSVRDLALDKKNNRLLVIADEGKAIFAVNLNTGARSIISSSEVGIGPQFNLGTKVALDSKAETLYVTDFLLKRIFSVDLNTGNRTILSASPVSPSNETIGDGEHFSKPFAITLDEANNRLLVSDFTKIFSVDLETGNRSVISSDNIGAGTSLDTPDAMSLDLERNRLLVTDLRLDSLVDVDLESGDRKIISNPEFRDDNALEFPQGNAFDARNNRLFVSEYNRNNIVEINLANGERKTISEHSKISFRHTNLVYDEDNNRLFATDSLFKNIHVIDLLTGQKAVFSE